MTLLLGLMLAIWGLAVSLLIAGTWFTLKHLRSGPPHLDAPFGLYPVSILKPLKGADAGLRENLESFFLLDYPEYELIFSVAEEKDPAHVVARDLMARYPLVSARVIVGQVEAGPNPKVNNLITSYESARYDWVLISDSNVRVTPDYLKRQIAHLETGVGMVTSVVTAVGGEGIGAHLEGTFLHTFYARGMLLLGALGRPPVVGKSMLFSRSTAARFGGIRNLSRYLAEDYMAGEAMRRLNLRVVVAADPIRQFLGKYDLSTFWSRHLRWGRLRKAQAPLPFAIEPFLGSVGSGLIGAIAFNKFFGIAPSSFILFHAALWSVCDLSLIILFDPKVRIKTPLFWFLREFLSLPLWLHIASGNTVRWRGNRLKLLSGGILESSQRKLA